MDGLAHRQTDRASYGDARTNLKMDTLQAKMPRKIMAMDEKSIVIGEKAIGNQCEQESRVQAKKQAAPTIRREFQ